MTEHMCPVHTLFGETVMVLQILLLLLLLVLLLPMVLLLLLLLSGAASTSSRYNTAQLYHSPQ